VKNQFKGQKKCQYQTLDLPKVRAEEITIDNPVVPKTYVKNKINNNGTLI